MGVSFREASWQIGEAVMAIFDQDRRVQVVGIGRHGSEFGFRAVRNVRKILPLSASTRSLPDFNRVPISYVDALHDVRNELKLPASGPGSPTDSSFILERSRQRHLVCGIQIQNFDDDNREGNIAKSIITIGTLGCFVQLTTGQPAILSNNHVIAGENSGQNSTDQIVQPGTAAIATATADRVATLSNFVALLTSPPGATPAAGSVSFNDLDVGVASLESGVALQQRFLPHHRLPAISGIAPARIGDRVFKVGRTTGLTHGEITSVAAAVGPVPYRPGDCWFRNSIEVEGRDGTQFSDRGDSGSAIIRTSGEVVGILYAGNGFQTYACPIDLALSALNCSLL